MQKGKIYILRFIHGLFALYFIACLIYLYFAIIISRIDSLVAIAILSLGIEGVIVFILNKGDCPLIHIQRKINDNTPFFELFLPPVYAKKAIPFFSSLTWLAVALLLIRLAFNFVA